MKNKTETEFKTETPLFIPLKKEHFRAFESGEKTHAYLLYGPRWNSHLNEIGRRVVLSLGYGRKHRLEGRIGSLRLLRLDELKAERVLDEVDSCRLDEMANWNGARVFEAIGITDLRPLSP